MSKAIQTTSDIAKSEQMIQNSSFDDEFGVSVVEVVGFDGQTLQRAITDNLAVKGQQGATGHYYVAYAAPGTAQATAKWQAIEIDTTSGLVVKYADGNSNFDNVASDLSTLTYS